MRITSRSAVEVSNWGELLQVVNARLESMGSAGVNAPGLFILDLTRARNRILTDLTRRALYDVPGG